MPSKSNYHLIGNSRNSIFDNMRRSMKSMDELINKRSLFKDIHPYGFAEQNGIYVYKLKLSKENVKHTKVDIKANTLTIKYKYKSSTKNSTSYNSSTQAMSRNIPIPTNADIHTVKAVYKNGFLEISLNKKRN